MQNREGSLDYKVSWLNLSKDKSLSRYKHWIIVTSFLAKKKKKGMHFECYFTTGRKDKSLLQNLLLWIIMFYTW